MSREADLAMVAGELERVISQAMMPDTESVRLATEWIKGFFRQPYACIALVRGDACRERDTTAPGLAEGGGGGRDDACC
jgi:hypothetical protein